MCYKKPPPIFSMKIGGGMSDRLFPVRIATPSAMALPGYFLITAPSGATTYQTSLFFCPVTSPAALSLK